MISLICIQNLIQRFLNQSTIPIITQNIALALLTIFIAVAIFLVDTPNFELDRKVLLNKVIRAKAFVVWLLLLFLPLLFWEISGDALRFLYLGTFFIATLKILEALHNTYKWMDVFEPAGTSKKNNYRMQLRFEYLKDINDLEERGYEWSYIWQSTINASTLETKEYVSLFVANVQRLIDSNEESDIGYATDYIGEFTKYLDKLPLFDWNILKMVMNNSFGWYRVSQDLIANKKTKGLYLESKTSNLLQEVIVNMGKLRAEYLFFDDLKEHVDSNSGNKKYIRDLIMLVSKPLFELEDADLYAIFDDTFPNEWRITSEGIKDKDLPNFWLSAYIAWVKNILWKTKDSDEYNKNLDLITHHLFPEIDPSTWASWITLLVMQNLDEHLKKHKKFGVSSRLFNSSGDFTSEELNKQFVRTLQSQIKATFTLLLQIFPDKLSLRTLEKLKEDAKVLQYPNNSIEKLKKEQLVKQIDQMLRMLIKQKSKK